MSIITTLLSGGVSKVIDSVKGVVDEFHLSGEEKQKFLVEMEKVLQARDSEIEQTIRSELDAKAAIITAELNQGDNFTKRARPSVVYFGLFATFFNYMLVPLIQTYAGIEVAAFELPAEFWLAWGGITSTYVVGRSAEKRGSRSPVTQAITGGKPTIDLQI